MVESLTGILVPIALCVVLPVMVVWLTMRHKTNETNRRTEVLLAMIEKNSNVDVEGAMKKMVNIKSVTLKERLLSKLMRGSVCAAAGAALMIYSIWIDNTDEMSHNGLNAMYLMASILLSVGIAIIVVWYISKGMLAKELELEREQAEAENSKTE